MVTFRPEQRTELIAMAADFEELARWAGTGVAFKVLKDPRSTPLLARKLVMGILV
jgi:hypothetical protein